MVICTGSTMQGSSTPHYALGSTDAEHERLIRQGVILAPLTGRLFREAGIGPGQRVLDVGSGVGDVAMLAAGLVGRSGELSEWSATRAQSPALELGSRMVGLLPAFVAFIVRRTLHEPEIFVKKHAAKNENSFRLLVKDGKTFRITLGIALSRVAHAILQTHP